MDKVPVHADIPHQEVIFLDETNPLSSPMKAKGVGEIASAGWARPSPTRSTMPPASADAIVRSRSTNCSIGCRTSWDRHHFAEKLIKAFPGMIRV